MMTKELIGVVLTLIFIQLISGGGYFISRLGNQFVNDPGVYIGYRYLVAAVVIIPLAYFKERTRRPPMTWNIFLHGCGCGFLRDQLDYMVKKLRLGDINIKVEKMQTAVIEEDEREWRSQYDPEEEEIKPEQVWLRWEESITIPYGPEMVNRVMRDLGHFPGLGLGKNQQGMSECISPTRRLPSNKEGLGYKYYLDDGGPRRFGGPPLFEREGGGRHRWTERYVPRRHPDVEWGIIDKDVTPLVSKDWNGNPIDPANNPWRYANWEE